MPSVFGITAYGTFKDYIVRRSQLGSYGDLVLACHDDTLLNHATHLERPGNTECSSLEAPYSWAWMMVQSIHYTTARNMRRKEGESYLSGRDDCSIAYVLLSNTAIINYNLRTSYSLLLSISVPTFSFLI